METSYPTKKLGEVCEVVGGGTPSTSLSEYWGGDIIWITPKDLGKLDKLEISDSIKKVTQAGLKNSSAKLLPKGSVVLSSRAPIGYVAIASTPLATNQGCRSFVCDESKIYNRYLLHFLTTQVEYLNSLGGGSTFKEISGSKLKEVEIPLPPLSEQKKTVVKLEKLLAKINEAKKLRAKAQEATSQLLSSELHKIFEEGKRNGWEEKDLGEVCEVARGGSPRPIKDYLTTDKNGINWIKISDATQSTKYIYKTKQKIRKEGLHKTRLVKSGDFILTNSMSFGRPYIMRTEGAIHDGWLVLRPQEGLLEEYMYHFLSSDEIYYQFSQLAGGAVVQNLNSELVRGVKISVPPLPAQKKIVERLDSISEKAKQLQEYQETTGSDLLALEQSILSKAFSGNFV